MKTKVFYLALFSTMMIFSQTQIGQDIDGEAIGDGLGSSVSLSSDGTIVAIGAIGNDANGFGSGQVRVYQNNSGVWTQIGQDIDGEAEQDASGLSVSLSADGNIVAIGAPYNDGNGGDSGHVRVYQNISDVWTQIGQDIDGEAANDRSGHSVSLSSDGSILTIGAYENDGNEPVDNLNGLGHVRVYQDINDDWIQVGQDIDGEELRDQSGRSVSLSADGNIVAIGAPYNDGNGSSSGQVRVYQNISDVWTQIGQDIDGEAPGDESGSSVSLSSDGSILAIGATRNDGNGDGAGQVRVYQNISGVWTQVGQDIDGEAESDTSGCSVSLSSDGTILTIGARDNEGVNGMGSGHVRVYQNISDVWTQIGQDIDGEGEWDQTGYSVSLSSNGSIVAIGAATNDGVNGNSSGHVRVYDLSSLLSIQDNEISKSFTAYPNPVDNHLQLQLSPALEFTKATIYNSFGQFVLQSKTTSINVSGLSSGIYFLEVETSKGKGVKKIIKK